MGKHTPGPWEARPGPLRLDPISIGRHGFAFVDLAKCWGYNKEADARLIAAAPELLAALEALAGELSAHAVTRKPEVRELLRRAQAALDLAGGRNDD